MTRAEDTLRGIITIIAGIFVIAILFTKNYIPSESIGIGIAFLGIWMLILSYDIKSYNKIESIIYFIFFLVSIITRIIIYYNIALINLGLSTWIYITGILVIISALIAITGKETIEKGTGITGIIIGIIFLIMNYYSFNLFYLAIILGIWLIIIGIVQFFISYDKEYRSGFYRIF